VRGAVPSPHSIPARRMRSRLRWRSFVAIKRRVMKFCRCFLGRSREKKLHAHGEFVGRLGCGVHGTGRELFELAVLRSGLSFGGSNGLMVADGAPQPLEGRHP